MALIVVMEDDAGTRTLIASVLRKEGHEVVSAEDAAKGLALLESRPPDLIISDVQKPGINGFEMLASVRRHPRLSGVPVILLTSLHERVHMRIGMTAGADDFITKPFRPAELREAVNAQLRKLDIHAASKDLAVDEAVRTALETQTRELSKLYERRLAKALSVDVSHIIKKATLLDGICPEAADLLKDRQFSAEISRVIRKMKPTRQVECIELMVSANNITVSYAEALLVATPAEMLVEGKKPPKLNGVTQEQMSRMEREMANLQGQYKLVEQTYAEDVLNLVLARGYLAKLLDNKSVVRYIKQRRPEVLEQFEVIVETTSLDQ